LAKHFPRCYYPENDDCFAKHNQTGPTKHCMALDDTDFGTRNCPFYKPYVQFKYEQKEAENVREEETD